MRIHSLDRYAQDSRFCTIDPRAKFLGIVLLLCVISFLQETRLLAFSLLIPMTLLALSRIPPPHLFNQFFMVLPFILFGAVSLYLTSGSYQAVNLALRTTTATLLLIFLGSTTPFFTLLKGLQALRIPSTYLILILMIYRYLFILSDELSRMEVARSARGFQMKGTIFSPMVRTGIIGTAGMVLVRAYDRGKRSYRGYLSRGFQGKIHTLDTLEFQTRDAVYSGLFISLSASLGILEWGAVL